MYNYLLLLLVLISANCSFLTGKENLEIDLKYFRSCPGSEDEPLKLHARSTKYNRTHVAVHFNVTVSESFDHTYSIDFEIRVWSDGGWKRNFLHDSRRNACQTLFLYLGPLWTALLTALRANTSCPIKPGFYSFDNFYLDISKVPLLVTEGRFYFITHVVKNHTEQACIDVELTIQNMF